MQTVDKPIGKREARKQDRRDAILEIARRSFLENGYAATSMSAIAAEVGGSKATLWNYFPSKEELFSAVLDCATRNYREQFAGTLVPSDDLKATLRAFSRSFLTKITSPDALRLHRLVAAEAGRFPEVGEIFQRRAPEPTRLLLAQFLEREMAEGHIRHADPLRAARTLISLCIGGVHQRMVLGSYIASADDIENEAENAADVFMRAYAPEC